MLKVTYVIADKLGGIASLTANLIRYGGAKISHRLILFSSTADRDSPLNCDLGADEVLTLRISPTDNAYSRSRRFLSTIGEDDGPLVSNDWLDLASLSLFPSNKVVFQIVHDEYNLSLSQRYHAVIDVMIAHSRHYYERLLSEFPSRSERIFYLPYGIPLAPYVRKRSTGPIRLLFLGRLHESKGVRDLPAIDEMLKESAVDASWTIIGDGPERAWLRRNFSDAGRISFHTPQSNKAVLSLCAASDILVFPTRFEGFPVALLEGMSAGLVPVVSNLPSGIPEVVTEHVGYRIAPGDVRGFAEAIQALVRDTSLLESMSVAARSRAEAFDARNRIPRYHELFQRWREFRREWNGPYNLPLGRLDRRYLPNSVVKSVRAIGARIRAKTE